MIERCLTCGHGRPKHNDGCSVAYPSKGTTCECAAFRERTGRLNAATDPGFYWTTHLALEHRSDRAYDEEDPGQVVLPNGSLVASFDRPFLAAACRESLHLWDVAA